MCKHLFNCHRTLNKCTDDRIEKSWITSDCVRHLYENYFFHVDQCLLIDIIFNYSNCSKLFVEQFIYLIFECKHYRLFCVWHIFMTVKKTNLGRSHSYENIVILTLLKIYFKFLCVPTYSWQVFKIMSYGSSYGI